MTVVDGLLALDELEAITLEELEVVADLQIRRDRKYLVPRGQVDDLVAKADARVLAIDGDRTFRYRSVYFDTRDLSSYLSAARRRPHRFKVRTRTYLDTDVCMLEVKTRDPRGRTVKHRRPHDPARSSDPTDQGLLFVASIVPGTAGGELNPTLTTRYRRATLVTSGVEARVTVDIDLAWEHPDGRQLVLPDLALIETKSPGPPSSFDRLLWRAGHRPVTISKYCTGLAAFVPSVPANKWHRVLQHFQLDA